MKIPGEALRDDETIFCPLGSSNSQRQVQGHSKELSKKISKCHRRKGQGLKSKKKSSKHFKFISHKNSNFGIIQSSTRSQVEEETDRTNSQPDSNQAILDIRLGQNVLDLDAPRSHRIPHEIAPHLEDIYRNLVQREVHYVPRVMIPSDQCSQLNRNVLAKWIFQICSEFKFKIQTFFLAVNILDRTMGLTAVKLSEMAAVAMTAVFMASKYEEVVTYRLETLTAVIPKQQQVTITEILMFESQILKLLNFDLSYSNPVVYLHSIVETLQLSEFLKDQALSHARQFICSPHWRYKTSSSIAIESLKATLKRQSENKQAVETGCYQQLQRFEQYLQRLRQNSSKDRSPYI